MPEISILMSVYNTEDKVGQSVESILSQTYRNFEFIIINDGSTDGTKGILDAYAKSDSRIKLIHQNNTGLTKALNVGLAQARGKYIARQDADDISLPTRLEEQLIYIKANPDIVLLGANIELIDDDDKYIVTIKNSYKRNKNKKVVRDNFLCHGTFFFPRKIDGEPVLYNNFYQKAQDYDLLCRLAEKGPIEMTHSVLYKWRFSTKGILATNITFYGDRARKNYLLRKKGMPEDFSPPMERDIAPNPSPSHLMKSLGIRYLSGYDLAKARHCFLDVLKVTPFLSNEYKNICKLLFICCLPSTIVQFLREH